ncbi:SatD family protein [Haloarcula sp. AONF1]
MAERWCVIIGDVIESRSVTDREALRASLNQGVSRATDALTDQTVVPFSVLKGVDEVGGVLKDPGHAYRAIREITESIHPTAIRFAVVHGEVDVGTTTNVVSEMDGPAFHKADRLLAGITENGRAVALHDREVEPWLLSLLADQIHLLSAWKQEWTPHQASVVHEYRERRNMQELADDRDVSIQAVSQTISRAKADMVLSTEENLEAAMTEVWG